MDSDNLELPALLETPLLDLSLPEQEVIEASLSEALPPASVVTPSAGETEDRLPAMPELPPLESSPQQNTNMTLRGEPPAELPDLSGVVHITPSDPIAQYALPDLAAVDAPFDADRPQLADAVTHEMGRLPTPSLPQRQAFALPELPDVQSEAEPELPHFEPGKHRHLSDHLQLPHLEEMATEAGFDLPETGADTDENPDSPFDGNAEAAAIGGDATFEFEQMTTILGRVAKGIATLVEASEKQKSESVSASRLSTRYN